ncbi:MAG: hypothetical protein EP329_23070 [Deltaproteobacteria bacterium]|nr:MAG: hypothetical protein EP329_23070 [Deltaproteobacteria bacterium]
MNAAALVALALFGAEPEVTRPELTTPPPSLPATLHRRGVTYEPTVEVTIDTDGVPRDVVVTSGPGARYEPAIIAAVEALRFTPARVDGEPRAVRLALALPVDGAAWQGSGRRAPEPTPIVAHDIAGEVLERGTRAPLAGLPVILDGDRQVLTGASGEFSFDGVPEGPHTLEIPAFDHEPARLVVKVPGEPLVVRLEPRSQRRYRTVVEGKSGDAVKVVIPVERAREVAGSSGDPIKVLEALPGVARPPAAGPGAGQISIRGSAPEDTRYYVDGLPLLQLYHFGNIYSVLQDPWIDGIDYRPGGFSVEFGDATGGLLDVALAELREDGLHGDVDVNVYHAGALFTVPLGDDWTVGAAFRRSYVDSIIKSVVDSDTASFSTAPRYYDYQLRADWRPSERRNLRLLAFGTDDLLKLVRSEPDPLDPSFTGFELSRSFLQIQGTYTEQLSDTLGMKLGLATSYQRLTVVPGGNLFDLTFDPITLRGILTWRGSRELSVRGGLDGTLTRFKVDARTPAPTKEGQIASPSATKAVIEATEEGYSGNVAGWVEAAWRPVDEVTVVGGVRATGWSGGFEGAALDPRATISWDVGHTTTLSLAGGINHQAPTPDETSETFGNPELGSERGTYVNLGLRQGLSDFLSIDLQGFYKDLDDLVTPTVTPGAPRYDNAGVGWVAGAELLVRLTTPVVDGWVSYTLSRSRRTDRPGEPERFYSADQTHVLAVVAGVELGAGWRFGGRFRYATGNPYTPLEAAYYDANADVYVPRAAAATLSQRLAPFLQLDLRLDKTFVFDTWELATYLEVSNVTNRENIEQVGYNFDYSARSDITSLPLVPSLGVRARW